LKRFYSPAAGLSNLSEFTIFENFRWMDLERKSELDYCPNTNIALTAFDEADKIPMHI